MAITKRTRFEVLRRDNHTCQYCGQMAPDVVLHVDHVEPVALGGSDKPDNLITACKDCNVGKSSIAPDSPLVQAVGAKAAAYALGMTEKLTRMRALVEEGDKYAAEFRESWDSWTFGTETVPLPIDWESTLHRWQQMGVPFRLVELAIPKAMALRFPKGLDGRFRYLCGVVWKQIDDADLDYTLSEATVHIYTEAETESRALVAYGKGYRAGRVRGQHELRSYQADSDLVRHHVDGTTTPWIDKLRLVS